MIWLRKFSIHSGLTAVGLILLVVGAKLWVVDLAGSSLPYRDQIDAEGESILRPWVEGRLEPSAFLAPHNEHRVVLTKLLSWLGVMANGQWDVYVQLCLNALLHAGLLLVVLRWLRGYLSGWRYFVLALLAVGLWVMPVDWENTLGGFQSQVYLVLGLSFLQIWGVLRAERADAWWWGGNVCGALALGTMASGMLSSLAVIAVLFIRTLRRRRSTPLDIASIGFSGLWVVIALYSRVSVPGHAVLKADSLGEFARALGQMATWPMTGHLPWSLLLALPAVVMIGRIIRQNKLSSRQTVLLGMGLWMLLTLVATAWWRGGSSPLISRYLTTYYFLVLLQGLALTWESRRPWQYGLAAGWATLILIGLWDASATTIKDRLPEISARAHRSEALMRNYFATADAGILSAADQADLPYPSAAVLAERWRHPSIQLLMPAAVRQPLHLPPAEHSDLSELPAAPYPVIAASPPGGQNEPWVWRSERQPPSALPVLRFRFSGGLGDPGSALHLRIVSDTATIELTPDGPARHRWKTINIFRPSGEWWIEMEDNDTIDRLALTAPVELGLMSWAAEKLIKFHFWWLSAGALLVGLGGLSGVTTRTPGAGIKSASPD